MPYDWRVRYSGRALATSHSRRGVGLQRSVENAPTKMETVYSFRTGKDVGSSIPTPEDSYQPSGNIAERLSYRRKFVERELTRVLSQDERVPKHFLLGDVGHDFAVSKYQAYSTPNTSAYTTKTDIFDGVNLTAPTSQAFISQTGELISVGRPTDYADVFGHAGVFNPNNAYYWPNKTVIDSAATNLLKEMNPLQQKASTAQTLIEFARGDIPRIGLRLLTHLRTIEGLKASGVRDAASAVGADYLGNVFGLTPVLKDVQAAIDIFSDIDAALFQSPDTRRVRQRELYHRASTLEGWVGWQSEGPLMGFTGHDKLCTITGTSGAMSFYAPGTFTYTDRCTVRATARFNTGIRPSAANNGFWDRGEELNRLLGAEFSPALIWELTPWSWLVDWFFNIGSVLENLSSLGLTNTILNYAYATTRREAKWLIHSGSYVRPAGTTGPGTLAFSGGSYVATVDQKIRMAASPFGFGVSGGSLSSGQTAILVALGLARSR